MLRMAYPLARQTLLERDCNFSRHDYSLAQLFACLVVREFLRERGTLKPVAAPGTCHHDTFSTGARRVPPALQ